MLNGNIEAVELQGELTPSIELSGMINPVGPPGPPGEDGFSPIANIEPTSTGATITITDAVGTTTADILNGEKGETGSSGFSPSASVSKEGKIATITITDLSGTTTAQIRDGEDGQGSGDMLKATYDTNDNGIVDNAEKVNNHTVASDVPANAVFTDTTYTAGTNVSISSGNVISATDTTYTAGTGIDITNGVISNTQTSAEWGNITGTLADQTDLSTALGGKQETLVSGTNIKTINSTSLLGSGDIQIQADAEVAISTTTPANNEVVWINPNNDFGPFANNEIAVLSGTYTNGELFVVIPYPSGFTKDNCVVISYMQKHSDSQWSYYRYYLLDNQENWDLITLVPTGVALYSTYGYLTSDTCQYKIVLMKIS